MNAENADFSLLFSVNQRLSASQFLLPIESIDAVGGFWLNGSSKSYVSARFKQTVNIVPLLLLSTVISPPSSLDD